MSLGQRRHDLEIPTAGRSVTEITTEVAGWLAGERVKDGLLTLFLRHTSASLVIQENADPAVRADLVDALARLAPEGAHYRHHHEGPDDMPAHIKAMLTSVSLSIPVIDSHMALGTWQGILLLEHRLRPCRRSVALQYIGAFL